jgi:hypothetical protein
MQSCVASARFLIVHRSNRTIIVKIGVDALGNLLIVAGFGVPEQVLVSADLLIPPAVPDSLVRLSQLESTTPIDFVGDTHQLSGLEVGILQRGLT